MAMRVFVGYGYNDRDQWIEDDVLPILRSMQFQILHGKDMHGEVLQDGVKTRISQSDALIGFCTLRNGQEGAEFNTHVWVRDELVYAISQNKPVLEVRESGVNIPAGIVGDRQRIVLKQEQRLACVRELVETIAKWNMRRLQVVPDNDTKLREIRTAIKKPGFQMRYRIRQGDVDSNFREARLEGIKGGLYFNAIGLDNDSLVEIEGRTNEGLIFSSDWESADAVSIRVL